MKLHKNKIQIYLTLIRLIGAAAALTLLSGCKPATKDPIQESLLQKPSSRIHLISRDISNWLGALSYQEELEQHEEKNKLDAEEQTLGRGRRIAARIIEQAVFLYPFSKSWEWDLHVLESDEFNANCRAGGKMIVNSYVLENNTLDDHQVAIVIGHEIAHALLEHSRSSYGRLAVAVGGGFVISQSFKMGQMRWDTVSNGIQTLSLPIDREAEHEADLLGLALMTKAGFDPVKGSNIWRNLADEPAGSKISTRLKLYESSHPTSQERLEFLSKAASQFAQSKAAQK
jgi:Zn-dependent protease with chaperone function